jgi:hypothetical protein
VNRQKSLNASHGHRADTRTPEDREPNPLRGWQCALLLLGCLLVCILIARGCQTGHTPEYGDPGPDSEPGLPPSKRG